MLGARTRRSLASGVAAARLQLTPYTWIGSKLNDLTTTMMSDSNIPKGFGKFFRKGMPPPASDKEEPKKEKKEEKKSSGGDDGGDGPSSGDSWIPMAVLGALGFLYMLRSSSTESSDRISFQQLYTMISNKQVQSIEVINKEYALIHSNIPVGNSSSSQVASDPDYGHFEDEDGGARQPIGPTFRKATYRLDFGTVDTFERNVANAQIDLGIHPKDFIPLQYTNVITAADGFSAGSQLIIPAVLAFGLYRLYKGMGKGGGIGGGPGGGGIGSFFNVGKANYKVADKTKMTVSFKDVAGLDEAKVEVMEFVQFLKEPEFFTRLGAKCPKGALLVGPPGTGKTLLAKAVAGEASVPFFSISGSDFVEMFVGVGPSRVRDLFKKARTSAPCIVFIDEIDAVGKKRSSRAQSNDERENTLNQLLVEMDGFASDAGVVVLAGTNRADILDPALLRPGRFDRQILIDNPDIRGRKQIFRVHLKPLKIGLDMDEIADRMAALTPGFSGADIANVCNEAALIAARHRKEAIQLVDFEAACDRVIGGLEKPNKVMNPAEKKRVAYHEAGHAVAGWFLEHASPLLKVTIVPRGAAALGYAQYLPNEVNLYNPSQLEDMVCMMLGGRCSEQIFMGDISSGASDDLKKVTNVLYSQISIYGMNDKVGNLSYQQDEGTFQKPYSEQTAQMIDEEARSLVKKAYARTLALLESKKDLVETLAEKLLEVETVNHDIIVDILGEREHQSIDYREFLTKTKDLEDKEIKMSEAIVEENIAEETTDTEEASETTVETPEGKTDK